MTRWLCVFIVVLTLMSRFCSAQFVLVKKDEPWGGAPSSIVVLRPGAGYQERYAVQQFIAYVQRANKSDALLPQAYGDIPAGWKGSAIVVGVAGVTPFEAVDPKTLPEHGFRIHTSGTRLNVIGQSQQGASNALHWLLWEKLGVRWYLPSRLGEELPVHEQIILDAFDVTAGPDYPASSFHAQHFGSSGNRAYLSGLRRDINSRHIWDEVIQPTPENHAQHPEWFALTTRKEMPKEDWMKFIWKDRSGAIRSNQVCTTHPAVIQKFVEYARKFFRADPEVKMLPLEPNDYHDFCSCDRCKALDKKLGNGPLMNRLTYFMNEVAAQVKKEFPDRTFGIYAYASHVEPPTTIKPDPMIVPTLCFFGGAACYQHAIGDETCPTNQKWKQDVLDSWAKLSPRFGYYSYYSYSRKWQGPQLMLRTLPKDMKLMHDLGAFYFHIDGWSNWATCAPMRYLAQRLVWDTDADAGAILDDWYHGTYGPASTAMKAYWETMTEGYYQGTHRGSGPSNPEQSFTREIIDRAWKHIKQAELDAAGAADRYRRRVAIARNGLEYTDAMALGHQHAVDQKWADAVAAGNRALAAIEAGRALEPAPYVTPMWPRDEHSWVWYRAWDGSNSSEKMTRAVIDAWASSQQNAKPTQENE